MAARCEKCGYHLEQEGDKFICLVCQRDEYLSKLKFCLTEGESVARLVTEVRAERDFWKGRYQDSIKILEGLDPRMDGTEELLEAMPSEDVLARAKHEGMIEVSMRTADWRRIRATLEEQS